MYVTVKAQKNIDFNGSCMILAVLLLTNQVYDTSFLKVFFAFLFQSKMVNSEVIDREFTKPFKIPSLPACTTSIILTIVTTFLDVGPFSKGARQNVRTSAIYRRWMNAFSLIKNPVIAFFNNQSDLEYFKTIRQTFISNTRLVKVDLIDLWAFKLAPAIANVYAQENYPKFYPNTATLAYTCAVHSKYDLMHRAATENYFNTDYFTFVDIGYFRAIAHQNSPQFHLSLPMNFNPSKVTYLKIHPRKNHQVTVEDVFLQKIRLGSRWILGC